MIHVNYTSGLGNRLFMYSFGRLLAESLDLYLQAEPIPGFAGTYDEVGSRCSLDQQGQTLRDGCFLLSEVLQDRSVRRIVLSGYFQCYDYFRPFKQQLREIWLRPVDSRLPIPPPNQEDLVIHVRRGDYVDQGWALPFSYYEKIIRETPYRRLILVTDSPQDPFLARFSAFEPETAWLTTMQAFTYMRKAGQLAISASTFSWWAGFLSDAKVIYFPKPVSGIWSDRSNMSTGINLFVDDEDRYVVRSSNELYRPSPVELLYHEIISKLQRRPRLRNALMRLRLIHEDENASILLGPPGSLAKGRDRNVS